MGAKSGTHLDATYVELKFLMEGGKDELIKASWKKCPTAQCPSLLLEQGGLVGLKQAFDKALEQDSLERDGGQKGAIGDSQGTPVKQSKQDFEDEDGPGANRTSQSPQTITPALQAVKANM